MTNQDTSYISVLETLENLKTTLKTDSNNVPAKLTLPTYATSSLFINLMLINQHIFYVVF